MPVPQELSASVQRYGLSYIRPYHREIARRLVLGQTQGEICKQLGLSPSRMSIIVNSPLFKLELKRLEKLRDEGVYDVSKTISEVAPVAFEVLERLLYNNKPSIQLQAATTILDRAGFSAVNKVQVDANINQVVEHTLTDSELRQLIMNRLERLSNDNRDVEIQEAEALEITYDTISNRECE